MSVNLSIPRVVCEAVGDQIEAPDPQLGTFDGQLQLLVAIPECRLVVPLLCKQRGQDRSRTAKRSSNAARAACTRSSRGRLASPKRPTPNVVVQTMTRARIKTPAAANSGRHARRQPKQQRQDQAQRGDAEPIVRRCRKSTAADGCEHQKRHHPFETLSRFAAYVGQARTSPMISGATAMDPSASERTSRARWSAPARPGCGTG